MTSWHWKRPPSERPLSDRQRQVLGTIEAFTHEHGYPPTVRELCQRLGLSSENALYEHLIRFRARGLLRPASSRAQSRSILLTPAGYGALALPLRRMPGWLHIEQPTGYAPGHGEAAAGRPERADQG